MSKANQILQLIHDSKNIVITSHRSPDGDAIGSAMGMYWFIKALGNDAKICLPDPCPIFLKWVKGDVNIETFDEQEESVVSSLNNADLIFCLDYNGANRLGHEMGEALDAAQGKKVMIDHHPNPEDFIDISISDTSTCSTCQLVYEFIVDSGNEDLVDSKIGTPLYLGIMTDTGSFKYSSLNARTHEILANLLKNGVNHTAVHENTYDHNRLDKLQLRSYIVANRLEIVEEHKVAIMSVTEEELDRFNYIKGDTDALVNVGLSVDGVNIATFFTEKDGMIKISFRSKGDFAINGLASEHFEGGGHKNASGGVFHGDLESAIEKFKQVVGPYAKG